MHKRSEQIVAERDVPGTGIADFGKLPSWPKKFLPGRPSSMHLQKLRALLGPLRAFEEKMKGYENSLRSHIGSHSP